MRTNTPGRRTPPPPETSRPPASSAYTKGTDRTESVGSASVCTVCTKRFSATPQHANAAAPTSHGRALAQPRRQQDERRQQPEEHDLGEQDPGAERPPAVILRRREARLGRRAVDPDQRVDRLRQHVHREQQAGNPPQQLQHLRPHQPLPRDLLDQPGGQQDEARTHRGGRKDEQEERGRPDRETFAERERPAAQHAVQSAQRALVEEREERARRPPARKSACAVRTRRPGTTGPRAACDSCSTIGRYSISSTVR